MTISPSNSLQAKGDNWDALVSDAISLLTNFPMDRNACAQLLSALNRHGPDSLVKGRRPSHLTSSLLVLDTTKTQVLLTLHPKAGMWLQLGGHIEGDDDSIEAAALREGREEGGLPMPEHATLVSVSPHLLGGGFTCREHLDVRFAVAIPANAPVASNESLEVAWWPIDSLPEPHGPDLPALIERALDLLG